MGTVSRMKKIKIGLTAFAFAVGLSGVHAQDANVKIGVLTDMSSVYSDGSGEGSVVAARLAIEDAGDVLGHKVELVKADHQHKADVGAGIARRWYSNDGVDMITDVPNSAVGLAVASVSNQVHKPAILVGTLSVELTGAQCGPYTAAWSIDTFSQAKVLGSAIVQSGGDSWFFLAANYAFGKSLVQQATAVIEASGGKVVGSVFAPLNTSDFSSFLLQAQQSKAKVIGLATAGGDTVNALKQADEFGIRDGGQKVATFVIFITDVKNLGLKTAQGLQLAAPFYWDLDDASRAFAKRFYEKIGREPTLGQAAVYSAVAHYLKAIKAAGTKDPDVVMAKMRELPVNDFMTHNGKLRADGRLLREMHLFEVKKPAESKGEWDLFRLVRTVQGEEAFRPLSEGHCPLVSENQK